MKRILTKIFLGITLLFLLLFGISLMLKEHYKKSLWNKEKILIKESVQEIIEAGQEDSPDASTDDISRVTITINGDASTSRGFTWYTIGQDMENYNELQVVELNSKGLFFSEGRSFYSLNGTAAYEEESIWHKAVADNLNPDTKYYFRIGDSKKNKWSKVGSFITSGATRHAFIAVGDTQTPESEQGYLFSAEGMATALAESPDAEFMIHTGDVVDSGGSEGKWKKLFDLSSDTLMNITIVPSAGNHESQEDAFSEHFNLLTQDIDTENGVYYSFDAGCAHYVVLNTNVSSDEITGIGAEQYEWLQADISDAKYNGAVWIIVVMHKGAYTVAMHSQDEEIITKNGIRNKLSDKLEELGVDLVIQGHDHYPSCTGTLKNGKRSKNGTVFLEAGATGPNIHNMSSTLSQEYLELFDYIAPIDRVNDTYQNYAKVEVNEEWLKIEIREVNKKKKNEKSGLLFQKIIRK